MKRKIFYFKSIANFVFVFLIMGVSLVHVKASAFEYKLRKSEETAVEIGSTNNNVHDERIKWVQEMKNLRKHIQDCVQLTNNTTWNCFKLSSARIFEDILTSNVIPLWPGVRLVRMKTSTNENILNDISNYYNRKDLQHITWFDRISMRLAHTLTTHLLQVNLQELTDAYMLAIEKYDNRKKSIADELGTARHRRQRFNMMITMMFGVTALGAVLVPMGFQMLSIVSGKALLLAKMALLLASINGLKKVANSGIHYGLYHVPGEHYGYYDRGDVPHHPRQVTSFAVAQTIDSEMGVKK